VPRASQRGFSAFELIIVLAILALMGSVYVFNYDPNNSKATALLNSTQEYANALKRAKTDMACYPTRMDALFVRGSAANSFCGLNLTAQWNGRYAEIANTDAAGNVVLSTIGPTVTVSLGNVVDTEGTHWRINVANVPNEVIAKATNACNGGAAAAGKCIGRPGAGGTGTFSMEFDLT
jgi:prepilin-type N-terminal cleavage/methylation domain-containing protein